ncbi:unnamed protein product [Leptidea sinapis]|uniref:Uncharacterized protein n=1 Tax=Leptidea sinapis TaxID=189913 RepID=A0A5E4Q1P2_9NEOP|nr:unnamed protein product [Leptidea sinapis]
MDNRSKASCGSCGKFKGASNPRNVKKVQSYLKDKSKQARLRNKDSETGSRSYNILNCFVWKQLTKGLAPYPGKSGKRGFLIDILILIN